MPRSGGRTWWAHFEFTRINIEPTILCKKIEDLRQLGAFMFLLPPAANDAGRKGFEVDGQVESTGGRLSLLRAQRCHRIQLRRSSRGHAYCYHSGTKQHGQRDAPGQRISWTHTIENSRQEPSCTDG